jgi:DNA mismatch repair protein MSH6
MRQSSLFSYFQRSQEDEEKVKAEEEDQRDVEYLKRGAAPATSEKPGTTKPLTSQTTSRRKKFIDSDDEEEWKEAPQVKEEEESWDEEDFDDEDSPKKGKSKGKKSQKQKGKSNVGSKGGSQVPGTNKKKGEPKGENGLDANHELEAEELTNMAPKKIDGQGNINYGMFDDPTPWWAQKENRLDEHKRKPDHPDYDPTTLYIPPDQIKTLTPAKRQFWLLKSKNMDKIIFFKLGKFYELFDEDAIIGVQELGLAFMGNKMHSGVPEVALDKFADRLVQLGYKVAIVEQTETERERKTRLSTSEAKGPENKVIQRDLIKVLTKGTYVNPQGEGNSILNTNYLWIFKKHGDGYGLCITELSLNQCFLCFVENDPNYSRLKMMVYQYRPTEIVIDMMHIDKETAKIFGNIASNPLITKINCAERIQFWNSMIMCTNYSGSKFLQKLDAEISSISLTATEATANLRSVFAGLVSYLNLLKILENHIEILDIKVVDANAVGGPGGIKNNMILDSQALEQLEIIEASHDFRTKRDDSLLAAVDRCVSQPGKRYLKSLLCAPFMEISTINKRLDAIEDLNKHQHFITEFQRMLEKIGDIERCLARLFKYSVKQKERYVLFEDISVSRLRELKTILQHLQRMQDFLVSSNYNCTWKSEIMKSLTSTMDKGGLLKDDLKREITDIECNILWTGEQGNIPVPKTGINREYDAVKEHIKAVQTELDEYLILQKQALKCHSLEYAHAKNRYEISVPEKINVPKEYSFSSCRQGFKRYITPTTQRLVDKLEAREDLLKEHMKEFALYVFDYFNKKRGLWENLSNVVKEIDVLCSLSIYSFKSRGQFCRPVLHPNTNGPFIELKNSRHPVLSRLNDDFVANDVHLGVKSGDKIMLLTGPNMGGKSTILRQVCLISILAQIGCYIPASHGELTVIDRIFTRLGASDKLVEGKSTFFVEMEDIYNLVMSGTSSSLAIVDELGRGTSTADGYSIAASILDFMVKKVGCLSMFSTHYHSLINFCLDYDSVNYWKMDYLIDKESQNIHFLYKLTPGVCDRSFGIKLGRLAGISEAILRRAEQVSGEIAEKHNATFVDEIEAKYAQLQKALEEGADLTKLSI